MIQIYIMFVVFAEVLSLSQILNYYFFLYFILAYLLQLA